MTNYYELVKTHPNVFRQLACKELLFVHYNCPIEEVFTDKWSEHNYFMYFLTGKMAYHTPGRSWLLTKGTAVFVKKGACIIEKFFEDVPCIVTFFVPDSYLRDFLRVHSPLIPKTDLSYSTGVPGDLLIPVKVNDIFLAYIESVLPYFYSETKPSEDLLELKFRELLLHMIADRANFDLIIYLQSLITPENSISRLMEANCLFNLTLADYAKLCNRSLSSFKRDFWSIYHTNPGHWLLNRKLDHAHQLLLQTGKSINDIAFESGFENSSHFSRAFKNRFGKAPLQYRSTADHSAIS